MSALPPIEPARPLYPVQRLRRRDPEEEKEKERRFDSQTEDDGGQDDEHEGDDRPHVDVRA